LSITPASLSGTQLANVTTTVTGSGSSGFSPTGEVDYYDNGTVLTYCLLAPANKGSTVSFTFQLNASNFWANGNNQITAIYDGDSHYLPSTSNAVNLTVTQSGGDFTMTPQLSQITVKGGNSGTVGLNLTALSGFTGVVNLACAPSSSNISCSMSPASLTVNGAATATVTINATAQAAGLYLPREVTQALLPVYCLLRREVTQARVPVPQHGRAGWLGAAGGLICAFVLLAGLADDKRKRRRLRLALCAALWFTMSCGGGDPVLPTAHSSSTSSSSPAGTYSVVVSGTAANGIIHNAKVIVVVQ
jgi:hypothetical protein